MPSKATQQPHGGEPDMSEEVALLGEYEYYLSQKQELLASFEGKVVLFRGKGCPDQGERGHRNLRYGRGRLLGGPPTFRECPLPHPPH